MTHEQKAESIMKLVRDMAADEDILKTVMEELRRSYREGFSAGSEDNRSREYASRYGHDMGQ